MSTVSETIVVSKKLSDWDGDAGETFSSYLEAVVEKDDSSELAEVEWSLMVEYQKGEDERGSGFCIEREDAQLILQMGKVVVRPDIFFEKRLREER